MESKTKLEKQREESLAKDVYAWALRQQGLTLVAIGLKMGVSQERVRQRLAKHTRRLKRQQETTNEV
jgi:hypothetical protein